MRHLEVLNKILARCIKENGCLIWTGSFQKSGRHGQLLYPNMRYKGKVRRGNRVVAEIIFGEDAIKDKHVLHRCDNSKCLNPEHLFLGTHSDNMQDKISKNRDHNLNKEYCVYGHPYNGENLIVRKNGARSCRTCMRKRWNEYDARNREARKVLALQRYNRLKGGHNGKNADS